METLPVSYEFAEKYVRFSKPEYKQLYLYLKYQVSKNGGFPKPDAIARDLDMTADRAIYILDFWVSRDELVYDETGYHFPEEVRRGRPAQAAPAPKAGRDSSGRKQVTKPSYTMAEIDAVASSNKSVSGLFYQAETVLNKILTPSDMEMLYSFVDWLGLPVEVITMLLSYAAKRGKTNRRYQETVAIAWAERGIDTFEAAEAHVMELEALDSAEHKIRGILGIYDRALTPTEKKYIRLWIEDDQIWLDLIPLAYDRTVEHTGKLSWAYMNKILQSWAAEGFTTPEQVRDWDGKFKQQSKSQSAQCLPKKSKINNYEDTHQTDYAKLEEQLLDMMLDHEG